MSTPLLQEPEKLTPSTSADRRPPPVIRPKERRADRLFRYAMMAFGLCVIALAGAILFELAHNSRDVWKTFGWRFLVTSTWDPVRDVYGSLPFIYGTLVSSALALLLAVPLGVGSAIFLAELAPRRISDPCTFLIELLAAIPSVILGLMGIFVLVPGVARVEPFFIKYLGFIPFFSGEAHGVGMFSAGLILTLMVLPYITSISRDVILSVPAPMKEASLGLGATRWETIRMVVLPVSRSGIMGAVFLALGRALGETMAVTMVIGNVPKIAASLFAPSYTMAAVIANEFAEATSDLYVHSLIAVGLALFGITVIVNGLARLMIDRTGDRRRGSR